MAFGPECEPVPGAPSSSAAESRVVIASRPDSGRPYGALRSRTDFSRVYRAGTRRRCGSVTVITCPGPAGRPRIGFVAGKRVGSAVSRNRAKRRMREAAARCELRDDTVYVLIADKNVLTADFESLVDSIRRCVAATSVAEDGA